MSEYPKVLRMGNGVSLKNRDGTDMIVNSEAEEKEILAHSFVAVGLDGKPVDDLRDLLKAK